MANFEDYLKSLRTMSDAQLKSILKSADPMWALAASAILNERKAK